LRQLQTVKLLTLALIELAQYIRNCAVVARHHDILNGIDTTIRDLDHFVQCKERSLK